MDILLIETCKGAHVRPKSVHGMLWLQTHFEDDHWEALASKLVTLPLEDAKALSEDAQSAGLTLNYLPTFSMAGNY